jgi:hypothetical protein
VLQLGATPPLCQIRRDSGGARRNASIGRALRLAASLCCRRGVVAARAELDVMADESEIEYVN